MFNLGPIWATVLIILVIYLFRFFRAKMKHKEILAAIEKGLPLPQQVFTPRIPNWITGIAIGIAFIVFSPAFVLVGLGAAQQVGNDLSAAVFGGTAFPSLIFLSIGLFFLIRGMLLRKHERQISCAKTNLQ
jgi:hypothetical protein